MVIGINGKEKPEFKEGQPVRFDLGNGIRGMGRIRGKATTHIIDTWIVEVVSSEGIDRAVYPWSCFTVPHPLLHPTDGC